VFKKNRTIIGLITITVLLAVAVPSSPRAQVGFQATLSDPPRVVSAYDETPDRFSAALHPMSRAVLSRILLFKPVLESGNFKLGYLTFHTRYHKDQHLVPVSADAHQFLDYRLTANERRRKGDMLASSIKEVRQGKRGTGLSIGVGLPKRFDQIFGEGGGNLRVSGHRRITFSGRSQWTDVANSDALRQSKFPSLQMEQVSRFDITGTIGSKITVKVSQDSQTDIPLANRIQIRYKGDDDDILKSIEAGNTTLNLPNTRFVGYSSRIQGLFGLKAEAQLGNLRMIAIASQEKGSSERASVSATGEEDATYIRDYAYIEGRIFDLGYEGDFGSLDTIRVIHVFEQPKRDSVEQLSSLFFIDPNAGSSDFDSMKVVQVSVDQFEVRHDAERNLHFIYFNTPRRDALGVYMEIDRYDENGFVRKDVIGSADQEPYRLKYIRALTVDYTPAHPTWKLMWRNCYRMPRGVTPEDIDIKVFKGLAGREGTSSSLDYQEGGTKQSFYLEILGLDQYNRRGDKIPDNIVDDRPLLFEPEWGLLIFPHRTPFNTDTSYVNQSGGVSPRLGRRLANIYNFTSQSQKAEGSQYYIQVTTKTRSSVIRLNRANIIEGSERVTLNGRLLTKGTDYNIQYDFGQVTLLSDEATDPNADLDIEFEYAPFLAVQKKTLFGLRTEYEWSPDLQFGSTILYKSDKAQDRKPRVGQETSKSVVLDFDASFKLYPGFITKAIDALPLVSTEAKSSISISGEIAQSHPNPNIDGNAYIDDFESSQDQLSISTSRSTWSKSSLPAIDADFYKYQRGKLLWHNTPAIAWEEVYESETKQGEGALYPLRLVYRPNNIEKALDTLTGIIDSVDNTRSWAGIMRYFGNRIDSKRLQLFEVRARGNQGVLHFDFGKISEDINGNNSPDTEDKDGNQSVDEDEDVGLDTIPDAAEVDEFGRPYDPTTNPDPAGDNWWFDGDWPPPVPASRLSSAFADSVENEFNLLHYEWVNGTERNRDDPLVLGLPDEEKLGSVFEDDNSYFSFHINLASDTFLVEDSENEFGWRTYRIPVRDTLALDSIVFSGAGEGGVAPDWASITHVRVWLESDELESDTIITEIAAWHFVQSNWQDSLITDLADTSMSQFFVASVSDEENVNFTPPPGVDAYFDKTNNITEAQRALSLVYEELQPNDTGLVTKDLVTVEGYSGYRRLEMYVYGPETADSDSIFFFFRAGRDHFNFYEYHALLRPGWDDLNNVNMDFNVVTALKDSVLRSLDDARDTVDVTSGPYRVVGQPNINEVRFFAIGLVNKKSDEPISGEVWVDELRVTDVRKDVGTAVRLDVSGAMADLLTYRFQIEHKDPYFRGLSSATRGGSSNNLGSGATDNKLSVSANLNFEKFLPRSWKAKIPIGIGYNRATSTPLLRNNSDIVLAESVREEEKSSNVTRRFSISESFSRKGGNLLFSALLNRQKLNFSYTRSEKVSVNNPFSFGETYNIRAEYDMSVRDVGGVPIFSWTKSIPLLKKVSGSKIYFFPNTWRWSGSFNRSMTITEDKDNFRRSSLRRDMDGRMNLNHKLFDNLTLTFGYSTRRDLTNPDLVNLSLKNLKLGLETSYTQAFKASYDPKLLSFLSGAFSYSADYKDTWDRSTSTRNSTLSRNWNVNGSFKHLELLGGKGQDRRYGSTARSNVRGGQSGKDQEKGKPFYDPPLAALRFLTGWINPVTYKYTVVYRGFVPALIERPSLKYRFGLRDEPTAPRGSNSRNPTASEGVNYDFSSGFKFLSAITTEVHYKRSVNRDLIKLGGDKIEKRSTGWPDLGIRISQFSYFPLIKDFLNGFIKVFSPRTGYSRQIKEDFNIDGGFLTSKSETISRSPLLALNFKLLRTLSLTGSYTISDINSERFNPINGQSQTRIRSKKKIMAFSSKYSFSSPGGISIPLLGKLKFKSVVSLNVNVKFTSDQSETSQSGGPFAVSVDKSDFSVNPVISYTFSQQIKGGLSAKWQDSNDIKANRKSHVRQLQIWTEIRF